MPSLTRRYVIKDSSGGYLYTYDEGWLSLGDDPTCWTPNPKAAQVFTATEASRMAQKIQGWHYVTIEEAPSGS